MLKIYTKLDDVPEALREHYKLVDGRYVPELSDDHPVLQHNKTLLTEKSQATARVKEIEADLEEAKKTSIPRGHTVVAKADADLLDKYKPLGTPDELATAKTERDTLKETETKRQRQDNNRLVAKELGYNVEAFDKLPDLPEFEIREKDGKKSVVAKVTEGDKVVEKAAKDFIESGYAPLLPALQAKQGVQVPANGSGAGSQPADQFQAARDFGTQYNETRKGQTSDLEARFGLAKSA